MNAATGANAYVISLEQDGGVNSPTESEIKVSGTL
jgi:hypothetical protein